MLAGEAGVRFVHDLPDPTERRYAGLADGVILSPVVSWAHDVKGWSADGLFNEGRRYVAELGWTNTFGGTCNNARNRDFVSLSAGLRF